MQAVYKIAIVGEYLVHRPSLLEVRYVDLYSALDKISSSRRSDMDHTV